MRAAILIGLLLPGVAAADLTGAVTVQRHGAPKADRSGVVVYVERVRSRGAGKARTMHISQRRQQFEPALTVLQVGDEVAFPNYDATPHHVFFKGALDDDLGTYKQMIPGEKRRFRKTGTVRVGCNLHPWMQATLLVLQNPFFAITGEDGTFRIPGLPDGEYLLVAWQVWGASERKKIQVRAGMAPPVSFALVEEDPPRRLRMDGTLYEEYKN